MQVKDLQLKRVLRTALLVLLLGAVGMTKGYAYDFSAVCSTGQTIYYDITDATNHYVSVVYPGNSSSYPWSGYNEPTGNLVIPEIVAWNSVDYSVTAIGGYAFYRCNDLSSVTIPSLITSIGNDAFKLSGLTIVNWNAVNITSYPNNNYNPFRYCTNLTTIVFGDQVQTIPDNAFNSFSSITDLIFGNSVTLIGRWAFYSCSGLTGALTIPNSVTTIGDAAFYNCSGLTTLNWNAVNVTGYPSSNNTHPFGNCTNLTTVVFGDQVQTIPAKAFLGFNSLTSLSIGNSITSIGNCAFQNCSGLTTVTWNAVNITSFPSSSNYHPFRNCPNLTTVVFGGQVETIPAYAFYYNSSSLSGTLTIPNSVISIGNSAFSGCSGFIGLLTIPNSVTSIGNSAFSGCGGLTDLTIGNSVTSIGDYAFSGCSGLTGTMTIPISVTSIGDRAFQSCIGLTTVNWKAVSVNSYPSSTNYHPFYNCPNLTTVVFGNQVQMIPANAFNNFSSIIDLTISNSVISIGDYAFSGCSGLTNLTIPNSVTSIGNNAFSGCSGLTDLTIPNSVTSIGDYAFSDCSGLSGILTIPNSVVTIGNSAFFGCSGLTGSLVIPDSVTTIGGSAFLGCSGFTSLTIGNSVASIGEHAFKGDGLTTVNWNAVNVSSYPNNYSINNLSNKVFNYHNLTTVVFGDQVETIPAYAFCGCYGLTNVVIPNGEIGAYAFFHCSNLQELSIGEGVIKIGENAFRDCSELTDLVIPNSVTHIGDYAFFSCMDLEELSIGEGVTYIGQCAFSWCRMTDVVIPNSVDSIGRYAFSSCQNLQEVTIGENVISIGDYAFGGCSSLATAHFNAVNCATAYAVFNSNDGNGSEMTLIIGENVTRIPDGAFCYARKLASIIIPNSVTYLGSNSFAACDNVQTINIGDGVTHIGHGAFHSCNNVQEVTIGESVDTIGDGAFWNCPALNVVRFNAVNCTAMQTTYNNDDYSVFSSGIYGESPAITSVILGSNVTRIPDYAFKNTPNLQRLIIPASVTYIGDYAFYNCNELVLLRVLGTSLTSIGEYAFYDCSNMVYTMNLPNLNHIGQFAFYNCSAMTGNLTIPSSINTIGQYTFYNCSGLTGSLTISDDVVSIGEGAFQNCSGLNGILTMPNNVTSIGANAFYNCSSLTGDLIIPNNVATIGDGAFYNCSGFTGEINIPRLATAIGPNTFYNCSGLSGNLIISKSITSVGEGAFYNCNNLTSIISECLNPPTAQPSSFENMTYTIPIHVPYGMGPNYQSTTGWNVFANYVDQFQFEQYDTDYWSDYYNWYTFELPTSSDVVCLNSDCQLNVDASILYLYFRSPNNTLTIKSGKTLYVAYGIGLDNPSQLIIEEGGHIIVGNGIDYTISASANPIEGGTVTGAGTYNYCTTATLTATANEGYSFVNWTKNGIEVSTETNYTFLVIESGQYVANFELNTYEINISANPEDGGAVSGAGIYAHGTIATLNATANEGFDFINWTENGEEVSVDSTYSFTVTGARTLVANFNEDTSGESIVFADANVKALCVANWDTNGDGELSFDEAETVTDLEQVFKYNSTITSFDELQYFIGLTSIGSYAFRDCYGLTSVTIPNSVTSIGYNAFYNCYGLASVTIPNSVTTINSAFSYCSGLTSVTIPNSVTSMGNSAFYCCSGLEEIIVDEDNPSYDSRENCNAIIETSTNTLITGCKNTIIPNSVTSIGHAAFNGCSGLTSLTIPNSVTSISNSAFGYCINLSTITVLAETPPTLGSSVFYNVDNSIPVYVPCSSISDYQSSVGWKEFTNYHLATTCASGEITVTVNPTEGGTVTGTGYYEGGTLCTLTAIPSEGFSFLNWMKNGAIASNDSEYSFVVSGDRELVANFVEGELCTVIFELYDSYGDGYTGNYLVVTDENGSQQLTVESGSSAVYTLPFLTGSHITLTWIVGSYPEDCSFTVSYEDGTVIYEGTNLSSSFFYEFDVDCNTSYSISKPIVGYGEGTGNWYLIASPVSQTLTPSNVANMINTENADYYDLYRFDQNEAGAEWQNYKAQQNDFSIVNGQGYLYANKNDVTLSFVGTPLATSSLSVDLNFTENKPFAGWNLIGNPFNDEATLDLPFYRMASGGEALEPTTETGIIAPMEGVFVKATTSGQTAVFTKDSGGRITVPNLNIRVLCNRGVVVNNAIVRFDDGSTLEKFSFGEQSGMIYIPQDGKDYAVASAGNVDEIPVNFKPEENGTYTLDFSNEEVTFDYLHLIDNITGADVDLLNISSYTFDARTTDYTSRFKLVFVTGNNGSENNFAFFSNGSLVINNEGNATLQVVDVMGRIIMSETINGCVNVNINATPGVYMLRLINGNDVKVQKIVVR